jgi:hypothetical protein
MAQMNRNANLEEMDTDAFMGISYLKHQTLVQKIIFIVGIGTAMGINLLGTFVFDINANLTLLIAIIPLLVGVAFGCNFNEDLSIYKYVRLMVAKPSKAYFSKPEEDLVQIRREASQIRRDEEAKHKQEEKMSDEAQKKFLKKVLIGALVMIVAFVIALLIAVSLKNTEELHHTVALLQNGDRIL